jgi:hypothetical protein
VILNTHPVHEREAKTFDFSDAAAVRTAAEKQRRVFEQMAKLAELLGHGGTFLTAPWEACPAAEKLRETRAEIDMRTELERALHRDNRDQTVNRLIRGE